VFFSFPPPPSLVFCRSLDPRAFSSPPQRRGLSVVKFSSFVPSCRSNFLFFNLSLLREDPYLVVPLCLATGECRVNILVCRFFFSIIRFSPFSASFNSCWPSVGLPGVFFPFFFCLRASLLMISCPLLRCFPSRPFSPLKLRSGLDSVS